MNRNEWMCFLALLTPMLCTLRPAKADPPPFSEHVVWSHGEDGAWPHHVYGLTVTKAGTLLAFAEARVEPGDDAPHHLAVKRSTDQGRTWSKSVFIERGDGSFWAAHGHPGKLECWVQSAPVVDHTTGRIFNFYALSDGTRQQRRTRVFYRFSDDDGRTWLPSEADGARVEVTALLDDNPHGWTFHMPGPGHGLQLARQPGDRERLNGRLIVQCWHRRAVTDNPGRYGVSLLVSDDHGRTWRHTGAGLMGYAMNESRIVELADGRLLIDARGGAGMREGERFNTQRQRVRAISRDAGETFDTPTVHDQFTFSLNGCDASLVRLPAGDGKDEDLLLFSRPADPEHRARMTVSISADLGRSWKHHRLVHDGPSFYSDLVILPDRTIGLLYGKGRVDPKNRFARHLPHHVVFTRFELDEVADR